MSLLEITGLTHSYGDNRLFKEATAVLNKGEHIGVVGQNGAGKSTLIKLCTGQIIPDEGRIVWQPKITIGYHLDVQAKEALRAALCEFQGNVLLVSHEEAFYRGWVQRVIHVDKNRKRK